EELGDPYHVAVAVMRQCWSASDLREGRAFADEAIPLLRRCGHLRGIVEMSAGMLGTALNEGDYEAADAVALEGLRAAEELGEAFPLALAVGNAGLASLFLERMDVAQRHFDTHVEIQRRERLEWWSAEPVICIACIAAHAGDAERAATLVGYGEAM